jgi:hypothetical protein
MIKIISKHIKSDEGEFLLHLGRRIVVQQAQRQKLVGLRN